jgi:hypothetical protein
MSVLDSIVGNAEWAVAHGSEIFWSEVRPIEGLHQPYRLPVTTDCSGLVTLCYCWAGAPDPNGLGYDGQGYTGTILSHCEEVIRQPQLADLVVFGPGSGEHVAIVVQVGDPIVLVSHGGPAGVAPHRITLKDEAAHHNPPIRFVRCPGL